MNFNIGDYLFFGHFDSESNEIVIIRHKIVAVLDDGLLLLDSGIEFEAIDNVDYSVDAALATGQSHADSYYNDMQAHYKQVTRTARV